MSPVIYDETDYTHKTDMSAFWFSNDKREH